MSSHYTGAMTRNTLYIILIMIYLSIASAQPVAVESNRHPSGEINNRSTKIVRTIATASNASTEMPEPYDTLSYNFANSTSCTDFYTAWRANETITNCHAVSLLLENSNSFFHTLRSNTSTTSVLKTSCSANLSQCATIMTELASDLLKSANCGADYQNNNAVVQGTYRDLVAYEPMYRATCLTNPETQEYCFVDAVSNTTNADDYNVYFMPLGNALSTGSKPTCNSCLRRSMDLFSHWAKVDGQSLDSTYLPSARVVNAHCGDGFAKTNITVGSDVVTGDAGVLLPGIGVLVSVVLALSLV